MGFKETKCVWSRFMLFITGITGLNLKFPVILCDNLMRQLHKTYCPPTQAHYCCVNTGTSTALTAVNHDLNAPSILVSSA